jgi:hypothetical protein
MTTSMYEVTFPKPKHGTRPKLRITWLGSPLTGGQEIDVIELTPVMLSQLFHLERYQKANPGKRMRRTWRATITSIQSATATRLEDIGLVDVYEETYHPGTVTLTPLGEEVCEIAAANLPGDGTWSL